MEENVRYSHPNEGVRHSYPLAIDGEGVGVAWALCLKTLPFIWIRLGVLLAFALGAFVWLGVLGGIALLFSDSKGQEGGSALLFIVGFGFPVAVFWWLRSYVLYLLKAGHVAVLTKLITEGDLPPGINQVEYGKKIVTEKFSQINVLFVLDNLIKGVVRAFNRTLDWISGLVPIPGTEGLMKVVHKIVDNSATYIDETIFSYNLARNDANVWRSSTDGLVYYAQNAKTILKTAVWVTILDYVLSLALFLLCLIPTALFSRLLPQTVAGFGWIFAILLALAIRSAVLHPLFLAMTALTFHRAVRGQEIDLSMSNTLLSVSTKFQELTTRAYEWSQGKKEIAVIEQSLSN